MEALESRRLLTAEIEPNDIFADATGVVFDEVETGIFLGTLTGTTAPGFDVDHFSFNLDFGQRLELFFGINADVAAEVGGVPITNRGLPPGLDVFNSDGTLIATSNDGDPIDLVTGSLTDLVVRIRPDSAFGSLYGEYGLTARKTEFTGIPVFTPEPNDRIATADLKPTNQPLLDSIDGVDDNDFYRVEGRAGDLISVTFVGPQEDQPSTEIQLEDGSSLALDTTGDGIRYVLESNGTHYVRLFDSGNRPNEQGGYHGTLTVFPNAQIVADGGDTIDNAAIIDLDDVRSVTEGRIDSLSDSDFYKFTVDDLYFVDVQVDGGGFLRGTGRELRLFNQHGQFLASSSNGTISTELRDALTPGESYFVEVSADTEHGFGPYALTFTRRTDFSLQRDRAVHFLDFDGTDSYLGLGRDAAYAVPGAQEFYAAAFNSRYSGFGVDLTLEAPIEGREVIRTGIGDFGLNNGASRATGSSGSRSPSGTAVVSATELTVDELGDYGTTALIDAFGHAVGLPNSRDGRSVFASDNTADYISQGTGFDFVGASSRQTGNGINDARDYLDWALESGSQLYFSEDDFVSSGDEEPTVSLDSYFIETTLDYKVVNTLTTWPFPSQTVSGDFDGNGIDDLATVAGSSDRINLVYFRENGDVLEENVVLLGHSAFIIEALAVDDFNNDGIDDIASVDPGGEVRRFIGLSSRGFTERPTRLFAGIAAVATGDFDESGNSDVIIAGNSFFPDGPDDGVQLIRVFANGASREDSPIATGANPNSIAVGDFDGDDNLDVVTANLDDRSISVLIGDGVGNFQQAITFNINVDVEAVAAGDFDGDGEDEIVVSALNERELIVVDTGGINGVLQLSVVDRFDVRADIRAMATVDINNDGLDDLIAGGYGTSSQVLLGDVNGGFSRDITFETGNEEGIPAIGDFDGDGDNELAIPNIQDDTVRILDEVADDPTNDRLVIFGEISDPEDSDRFTLDVEAGQRFRFDVEAAEFQRPLNSVLRIFGSDGRLITEVDDAIDGDSGLASVDPYLEYVVERSEEITIEIATNDGSLGSYRFKVVPERAFDQRSPRIYAVTPENQAADAEGNQIVVFFDDQIDPATLTADNVIVEGASSGIQSGTTIFNPLDATLTWTANSTLAADTYTLRLVGGSGGLADFFGNLLDGEAGANFAFPNVSGDGTAGGDFTSQFTIATQDSTPATIESLEYFRDPYNRSRFDVDLDDSLSIDSLVNAQFTLDSAGIDGVYGTADDYSIPLDVSYDSIDVREDAVFSLYSRGVVDSNEYRLIGSLVDDSNSVIDFSELVYVTSSVPDDALFRDAALTQPGIEGSYVNGSLRNYQPIDDWRVSQIVTTRIDQEVSFGQLEWGDPDDVGVPGTPANWNSFSAQWDGFVEIPEDGIRLVTRSNNGSRLLIDVDGDGTFEPDEGELFDNGFGIVQEGVVTGTPSDPLLAGVYEIRMQYEEGLRINEAHLDWIYPSNPVIANNYIHGPSVVSTSVTPENVLNQDVPSTVSIQFSGQIDPATLTTDSLRVRFSEDPVFFEASDVILPDVDNAIDYDPETLTATIDFGSTLIKGYYLIEANGLAGGIADLSGNLIDGENTSVLVAGNQNPFLISDTPSGDGKAGGTFRLPFAVNSPELEIIINDDEITEATDQTTATIRRKFALTDQALTVQLEISDLTELTFASNTVTIPAGETSVVVNLVSVDDDLLDGTQTVTVTASADGLASGSDTIDITDVEGVFVSVQPTSISELGGTAVLTVRRLDSAGDLTVNLASDRTDKATIVSSIVIPDGELTATAEITAIDNALLDGTQTVTFTASSAGLTDSTASLEVTDFEELTLTIVEESIREDGGIAMATITRTDPTGNRTAAITTSTPDLVSVPATTQFLDGNTVSEPFQITAIDNQTIDLVRTAGVIVNVVGYEQASDTIDITDFESLALSIDAASISEAGGTTTGRVIRTDPAGSLVANLSLDRTGRLMIPTSVTFADGQTSSEPFMLTALDNNIVDGNSVITVTATANGYSQAEGSIEVTDSEELTLTVLDTDLFETSEQVRFRVERPDQESEAEVTITGGPTNSTINILRLPESVTIPAGSSSVEFVGLIRDNNAVGSDVDISVNVFSTIYASDSADFVIQDNDVATLSLELDTTSISESAGTIFATLVRNTRDPLQVSLSTDSPGDLDLPTSVSFAQNQTEIRFTISPVDNDRVDGDRPVTLNAVADDHPSLSADLSIVDDEVAGVRFVQRGSPITEGGDSTTISLALTGAPLGNVVVALSPDDSGQLSIDQTEFTFRPTDWNIPQVVNVTANDDLIVETTENSFVFASVVADRSDAQFANLPDISTIFQVVDNDVPSIELLETENSTIVIGQNESDTFSIRLSASPRGNVRLLIDTSELTAATVDQDALVFTPDNWDQAQTVTVQAGGGFGSNENTAGRIFVRIDPQASDPLFADVPFRTLGVVVGEIGTKDLQLRTEGSSVVLVDAITNFVFQRSGDNGGVFELSSGDDTVTIQALNGQPAEINALGGDDTIRLASEQGLDVDGGVGRDRVVALQEVSLVDMSDFDSMRLDNIEVIDLLDQASQTLRLNPASVTGSTDSDNLLLVESNPQDTIDFQGSWVVGVPDATGDSPVHNVIAGNVTVQVSNGMLYQNPLSRWDVDRNGDVSARDALLVVNQIASQLSSDVTDIVFEDGEYLYYDVTGDNRVTALDALRVVNRIANDASPSGDGEQFAGWTDPAGTSLQNESAASDGDAIADNGSSEKIALFGSDWNARTIDSVVVDLHKSLVVGEAEQLITTLERFRLLKPFKF